MAIIVITAIGFKIVEADVIWYVMVVKRKQPEWLSIYLPLSTLVFVLMILYNVHRFY